MRAIGKSDHFQVRSEANSFWPAGWVTGNNKTLSYFPPTRYFSSLDSNMRFVQYEKNPFVLDENFVFVQDERGDFCSYWTSGGPDGQCLLVNTHLCIDVDETQTAYK